MGGEHPRRQRITPVKRQQDKTSAVRNISELSAPSSDKIRTL